MKRSELAAIAMNQMAGLVYAVVYDGSREIEKLVAKEVLGRKGTVLSWVPLEFKPK